MKNSPFDLLMSHIKIGKKLVKGDSDLLDKEHRLTVVRIAIKYYFKKILIADCVAQFDF